MNSGSKCTRASSRGTRYPLLQHNYRLQLVADDSVYEYEKANLPEGAWPPTSWYADWVSGLDVFDVDREDRPIEMRWLVYQKEQ